MNDVCVLNKLRYSYRTEEIPRKANKQIERVFIVVHRSQPPQTLVVETAILSPSDNMLNNNK